MKTVFTLLTLLLFNLTFAQSYTPVDKGSKVKFVIDNFGIATGGTFEGLAGSIQFDPNNLATASFNVTVDVKTVDTDIDSRDNHLKKEEYFHVEKYPHIIFKSTRVTKSNAAGYLYMFGTITIKGVTKEIRFPFKANEKDGGMLFEGKFKLNRRDFGVGGKSMSMDDNLDVNLSIFARKA